MIVVDHLHEGLDFVATGLFLLAHTLGYLAWITRDASDDGMAVATFVASFVVRLCRRRRTIVPRYRPYGRRTFITTALRPA